MSTYLTEEEQIEAFKRWWSEHGTKTVAAAVLFSAAYFSWNWWGDAQYQSAQQASSSYDSLVEQLSPDNATLSDEQRSKLTELADSLGSQHSGSAYVDLAKLQLAKLAVEVKDYDKALTLLGEADQNTKNDAMKELIKLRKARVLFALEKFEEALALLTVTAGSSYESAYTELRGDIYVAQGKLAEAETAYNSALNSSGAANGGFSMRANILQYKISNTKIASPENPLVQDSAMDNPHGDAKPVSPHSAPAETQ